MNDARITLLEAIARKRVLTANYNGKPIRLAPHALFERHGDLFVRALNLDKAWRADEEPRLGQFKLAGLGAPELLDEGFEPLTFDAEPQREGDTLVLAV